jgi:adenylate cyclase
MKIGQRSYNVFSGAGRYRIRTILFISFCWTIIDLLTILITDISQFPALFHSMVLREVLVFVMSLIMGYLFVFALKTIFKNYPLWLSFIFKTVLLLLAAFLMNFMVHFVDFKFVEGHTYADAFNKFFQESVNTHWLMQKTFYWIILFILTQLYIEINEKYSPGVFADILMGRYINPKVETRIVMFIDLRDSTPIAEKLGHQQNFLFIRDFVTHISMALIEYKGRIYQYVGDEIIVSWIFNRKNIRNCLASVIEARKNIQQYSERFRRKYNIVPEFRIGIHVGEVTVGEIGVIKKDLAMSGDTMNTTARIRNACNELNQKYIASKDFMEHTDLKDWQSESLGVVDLKGKASGVELFSLKI